MYVCVCVCGGGWGVWGGGGCWQSQIRLRAGILSIRCWDAEFIDFSRRATGLFPKNIPGPF